MRLLVVDDDAKITALLSRALTHQGYEVLIAHDGYQALAITHQKSPDLIVLDLMLPDIDGIHVCKRIRQQSRVPILMLTAKDEVNDRVMGLDSGADDYLVKPFALDELLARVRALLRRASDSAEEVLRYGDLVLDVSTRQARRGERTVTLTAKEFDLLQLLMRNPRRVLTRQRIMEEVWGYDFEGESNVLEVYVGYLRQKLEAENEPRLIHTVRGVGYVLREE